MFHQDLGRVTPTKQARRDYWALQDERMTALPGEEINSEEPGGGKRLHMPPRAPRAGAKDWWGGAWVQNKEAE